MKNLLFILSILVAGVVHSGEPVISLTVVVKDDYNGHKLEGATVSVFKGDELFLEKKSASNGKVPVMDLPIGVSDYSIVISKEGYVSKLATLDATFDDLEDLPPFIPFPIQTSLINVRDDIDFSWLEETPMIKFHLDKYGNQTWDQEYTKGMLTKVELTKDGVPYEVVDEYSVHWLKANKLFRKDQPQEAWQEMQKCQELWPEGDFSLFKAECDLRIAEMESPQEYYEKYITQGDKQFNAKEWYRAKQEYKNAIRVKPEEQYAYDQVAVCDQKIKEIEIAKENKAKFDNLIYQADQAFEAEKYEEAKELYQQASKVDPNYAYPIEQIEKIDVLMKEDK